MAIIKTRKIKLYNPGNDNMKKAVQVLNNLKGVKKVNYDQSEGTLTISYDLESVMLIKIEEKLQTMGLELDISHLAKIKRGWQHFTEQNELENMHVNPTCCSNPKELLTKTK